MNAEQHPWQVALYGVRIGDAHDDGRPAGAAVGARIGEEVALALKTQAEGRGDDRLAHHGHVVQRVVEAKRKTHDQQ